MKSDASPQEAIEQIKEKQYALKFQPRSGEAYTGRILAVGISYDRTTKAHSCAIEVL